MYYVQSFTFDGRYECMNRSLKDTNNEVIRTITIKRMVNEKIELSQLTERIGR